MTCGCKKDHQTRLKRKTMSRIPWTSITIHPSGGSVYIKGKVLWSTNLLPFFKPRFVRPTLNIQPYLTSKKQLSLSPNSDLNVMSNKQYLKKQWPSTAFCAQFPGRHPFTVAVLCVCASPGAECLKRALLPRGLLLMPSSVSTMSFIWEAKISGDEKPFGGGWFLEGKVVWVYSRQMFDLKPTVWLIEGGNLEKSWLLPWGPASIIKSLRETLRDASFWTWIEFIVNCLFLKRLAVFPWQRGECGDETMFQIFFIDVWNSTLMEVPSCRSIWNLRFENQVLRSKQKSPQKMIWSLKNRLSNWPGVRFFSDQYIHSYDFQVLRLFIGKLHYSSGSHKKDFVMDIDGAFVKKSVSCTKNPLEIVRQFYRKQKSTPRLAWKTAGWRC